MNATDLLTFRVGPYTFCTAADEAAAIINRPSTRSIPRAPRSLIGVFGYRGGVVPVVSLRRKLSLADSAETDRELVVLTKVSEEIWGVLVDAVQEVLASKHFRWEPVPPALGAAPVDRFGIHDGKVLMFTGLRPLIALPEPALRFIPEKSKEPSKDIVPENARASVQPLDDGEDTNLRETAVKIRPPHPEETNHIRSRAPVNQNCSGKISRKLPTAHRITPKPKFAGRSNRAPRPVPLKTDTPCSVQPIAGRSRFASRWIWSALTCMLAAAIFWGLRPGHPPTAKRKPEPFGTEASQRLKSVGLAASNEMEKDSGAPEMIAVYREALTEHRISDPSVPVGAQPKAQTVETATAGFSEVNPQPSIPVTATIEVHRIETRDYTITVERPFSPSAAANTPSATPDEERRPVFPERIHRVVRGDTLWDISERYLGTPWRYPELAENSRVRDPDLIFPGDLIRFTRKH